MTFEQIHSAILTGRFTNQQIRYLIQAVELAREQLALQNIRALAVGDAVSFTRKTGAVETGRIVKIAIKNLQIRTATGLWRVPANMVTRVEDLETA